MEDEFDLEAFVDGSWDEWDETDYMYDDLWDECEDSPNE